MIIFFQKKKYAAKKMLFMKGIGRYLDNNLGDIYEKF